MPKKSKEHVQKILNSIREYRKQGMEEHNIRHTLALFPRTWERYIKKIHEEDKAVWLNITRTQLENELLKLKASYEETYKTALDEVKNATTTPDRLLASECKDNARLDIIRLLADGSDYVKKIDDYVADKTIQKETKPKREVKH